MRDMLPSILKYLGVIIATGLGILGLLVNFRDERTREITTGGRLLLACIVLSGMVVIGAQVAEDYQAARERGELLEQVARSQLPLRDVSASCRVRVPMAHEELQGFRVRVSEAVTHARPALMRGNTVGTGFNGIGRDSHEPVGHFSHVTVCNGSPLYPDQRGEPFAYTIFESLNVMLSFYKVAIPVDRYPYFDQNWGRRADTYSLPDVRMTFLHTRVPERNVCIEHNFERGDFYLESPEMRTESRFWSSSGKIISVPDLRGTQMFVEVFPLGGHVKVDLDRIVIQIGDLRGLWLTADRMTKHVGAKTGHVLYEFRFPGTTAEIERLSGFP